MKLARELEYKREKIERADKSFFNLLRVKTEASSRLEFKRVDTDNIEKKLFDVGYLRLLKAVERGSAYPFVVVWAAFEHSASPLDYFENILQDGPDIYMSLNAWINEKLDYLFSNKNYYIKNEEIYLKDIKSKADKEAEAVLDFLKLKNRIKFYHFSDNLSIEEVYQSFDPVHDLTAVGQIDYPSEHCKKRHYQLGFNASFFLLEFSDWESKYSLLGDPYNLQISEGEIKRPPIYRRSALLLAENGGWVITKVFLTDLLLEFKNQQFDLSKFAVNIEAERSIYTRYYGVKEGCPHVKTPLNKGKIELIIIDKSVVGIRKGGNSEIPQNSFVLSLPKNSIKINNLKNLNVNYSFRDGKNYISGIQNGPSLIEDGEIVLDENSLIDEQFFGECLKKSELKFAKVVPTDYAQDIDKTRAARIIAGVDEDGNFSILAVESANSGMALGDDSSGATLKEMAELALERNFKYALNLDGGGSTNIQYHYGSLLKTADRRGLPGVVFERMVPVLGALKN